ncbi:hypothetical protein GOODEAATRI_001400, partial [Goodea atripinnis]
CRIMAGLISMHLPWTGFVPSVKCYHRRSRAAEREVVFRVQFHTCTVHGAQLWFGKAELDLACTGIKNAHAHPVAEITWDHPIHPPSLPCLNRPCYPYTTPEHALAHSHTLPASNRCYPGEECHLLQYPGHGSGSHPSLQPHPGSPYREVFISSPTSASYCPCQDCSSRREHQSTSVKVFRQLHPDQTESPHWLQGARVQQSREAPRLWEAEKPWELTREADLLQCKTPMLSFNVCHSPMDHSSNPEQPRFAIAQHQNYPIPQSLMDARDGFSSGYNTPLQPQHSFPCSPYQSSPSENRESRGYASGYHSGSASPLPASSPSPARGRLPDIPLGSESKSDVHCQSSTTGVDSDHDYTVIGSSSPTHTEDRLVKLFVQHSSPKHSITAKDTAGQRLTPDRDISTDTKPPSPVPDGYHTPTFPLASYYYSLLNVPHVPYTGYTAVTIPTIQPPLPEKKRFSSTSPNGNIALLQASSCPSPMHHVTFSPAVGEQRRESAQHSYTEEAEARVNSKFVQDSSKYWYKPGISRDQGDPVEQLVRHFLIETGPRGVKIKGCQNESYFGSLSALVMFGFVARRTGTTTENVCHLFAEMDPEQPAVAIVNFINKVMLGPQLRR